MSNPSLQKHRYQRRIPQLVRAPGFPKAVTQQLTTCVTRSAQGELHCLLPRQARPLPVGLTELVLAH